MLSALFCSGSCSWIVPLSANISSPFQARDKKLVTLRSALMSENVADWKKLSLPQLIVALDAAADKGVTRSCSSFVESAAISLEIEISVFSLKDVPLYLAIIKMVKATSAIARADAVPIIAHFNFGLVFLEGCFERLLRFLTLMT